MMLWKRLGYLLPWRRRAAEQEIKEEIRTRRVWAPLGARSWAGLLLGVLPALRAPHSDRSSTGLLALSRVRAGKSSGPGRLLVVLQLALSLVLMVGTGLFVRSLQNLNHHDVDLDRHRVIVVRIEPRGSGTRTPAMAASLDRTYRDLLARLELLPGVRSASLARSSPLSPTGYGYRIVPRDAAQAEMLTGSIV
jgi:hypothetical protein